ncbi:Protein of unknown function DUF1769 [Lasallia pustulata]|uniref:Domain of unknown function at the cortex 1 domain-containing protein n=1 Tax=Lasallia pustulata TaxID=136370 RepID=A0A1W5CXN8_9LECA|nr:Protein of unknown function DUF1769 [Lasallia pustulata]
MADKYLLRVTAGPSYDSSTHQVVAVNGPDSTHISSEYCTANVNVRIKNYRGLPLGSPKSSPYFSSAPHTHDQYSIAFTLIPHKTISGNSLVFGNDFDYPIRDRLPPGSGTALHIVKWAIDPGLDGDVYSDKPHLYGPLLSSINLLRICDKVDGEKFEIPPIFHEDGISEGGIGEGEQLREAKGVPHDPSQRKKWFLHEEKRKDWEFEAGRVYQGDFFNPYIDFNDFSLKLPGFSLSVLGYIGKQDSLRYVLKNRDTGDVFFVVVFTLVPKEDTEKKDAKEKTSVESKGKEGKTDDAYQPKEDDVD